MATRKRSEAAKATEPEFADERDGGANPGSPRAHEDDKAADELRALVEAGASEDFSRVVRKVFRVDVEAAYDRLEKDLAPDPDRVNFASIYAYVDRCEENARIAHQLFAAASIEYERVKKGADDMIGAIRKTATEKLEAEKKDGTRSKAITNGDVEAAMCDLHGDELLAQETTKKRAQLTRDHLEELSRIWKIRCSSAASMLNAVRK